MRSKDFPTQLIKEIGLYLLATDLSPFLKIGVTCANFHKLGYVCSLRDKLKSKHKGMANDIEQFFNIR